MANVRPENIRAIARPPCPGGARRLATVAPMAKKLPCATAVMARPASSAGSCPPARRGYYRPGTALSGSTAPFCALTAPDRAPPAACQSPARAHRVRPVYPPRPKRREDLARWPEEPDNNELRYANGKEVTARAQTPDVLAFSDSSFTCSGTGDRLILFNRGASDTDGAQDVAIRIM